MKVAGICLATIFSTALATHYEGLSDVSHKAPRPTRLPYESDDHSSLHSEGVTDEDGSSHVPQTRDERKRVPRPRPHHGIERYPHSSAEEEETTEAQQSEPMSAIGRQITPERAIEHSRRLKGSSKPKPESDNGKPENLKRKKPENLKEKQPRNLRTEEPENLIEEQPELYGEEHEGKPRMLRPKCGKKLKLTKRQKKLLTNQFWCLMDSECFEGKPVSKSRRGKETNSAGKDQMQ